MRSRSLAILIAAALAAGAIYHVLGATRTGMTSALVGLGIVAVLAIGTIIGAIALWRGARWGAILIALAAVLSAFVVQQNQIFLAFGGPLAPELALQLPYVAWAACALVALFVALSWKGLGQQ